MNELSTGRKTTHCSNEIRSHARGEFIPQATDPDTARAAYGMDARDERAFRAYGSTSAMHPAVAASHRARRGRESPHRHAGYSALDLVLSRAKDDAREPELKARDELLQMTRPRRGQAGADAASPLSRGPLTARQWKLTPHLREFGRTSFETRGLCRVCVTVACAIRKPPASLIRQDRRLVRGWIAGAPPSPSLQDPRA